MRVVKKYILEIVVFVSGAVVMIFELVGSRIIGPYVGTSTYVWTSLIGIVLASLSLGYYLGGKIADKKPEPIFLGIIIAISSVLIALSALFRDVIPLFLGKTDFSLEIKSVLVSIFLFGPASLFLGMVSPYAIRLRFDVLENAGRTAGNLYALSTLGSIFGTFLAGFYIIPSLGSASTLIILSAILFVLALLLFGRDLFKFSILIFTSIVVFLILLFFGGGQLFKSFLFGDSLLLDEDTEYSRIWVFNSIDQKTNKPIRILSNDPYGLQSAIFVDGTDDLVFDYTKFYRLVEHFNPNIKSALAIGGCAYTEPRDFLKRNPKAFIDVVEIDPGMTEIAKSFFGLKDDPRLSIFHEDGKIFLNKNTKKYDAIFIDAFNSSANVPFHLTTKETAIRVFDSLSGEGIVIMNIISAVSGDKGKFLRAEYATYKSVFPQVYIFPLGDVGSNFENQNVILIALKRDEKPIFKSSDKNIEEMLSLLWTGAIDDDVPILIDDYAPVEYYKKLSL